jgi:hypothetical protein
MDNLPDLLNACGPTELELHVDVLDAAAMGSPQLGPLSMGLPHAEVPLSTVVAGVEGSPQGSPQPLESMGKEVISIEDKEVQWTRDNKEYLGNQR